MDAIDESSSQIQELTFQVPIGYSLPPLFLGLDAEGVSQVLTLGAEAYTMMVREGQKLNHKSLYKQLKEQAAQEYEPKLHETTRIIEQYQVTIDTLKHRLEGEEETRKLQEKRIREEERKNREEIMQEKEQRIQSLETQINANLRAVESSLHDKFLNLANQLTKGQFSSKSKGEQGEALFSELLLGAFGTAARGEVFSIEDVGKEARQGDIRMTWQGHRVMWEIKNYDYVVPTKEVQKFIRDMEEARDVQLGVMVSLHTNISGHTKVGGIDLVELSDGRFCIYVNRLLTNADPLSFLQSLKPFLEVILSVQKTSMMNREMNNTQESVSKQLLERFEEHRQIVLRLLKDHEEKTRAFRNVIMNAKKKSEGIWTEISVEITKAEHSISLLLSTLLNVPKESDISVIEDIDDSEETFVLPAFVFRNTELIFYNETQKKFIKDLFTIFEVDNDMKTTITKKELKEKLKSLQYTDDTSSKLFEQVLLDDVWNKGKQTVKYLKVK
jgi:hypothetical protein